MKTKILFPLAAIAAASAVFAAEQLDEATQARITKAEAGPATIDVSSYPKPFQERYKVFLEKCAACHKINRAINSDYALPDEWERYIKRMMHKPGSGMDKASSKQVFEFLAFDSSVRKKNAFQEKLKALPEAERKIAEDKVKEITDKYK